jgi:hypothetical protein
MAEELFLIDDFSGELSRLGTAWEGFTDQVMGGDSRLRTPRTVFPWAYFGQPFAVSEQWTTVRLPFAGFRPQNMSGGRLEPGRLLSLAIVAIGREFDAELFVQSVGFYR